MIVYLAEPDIGEVDLPPQFRGNLWTTSAQELVKAIRAEEVSLVRTADHGYCVRVGAINFNVKFGRIESFQHDEQDLLVALPANEFFDDECINDPKSALGAFMQHYFAGKIPEIQALVRTTLSTEKTNLVEKRPGERVKSYGVGKCVYLSCPLGSNLRVAMIAVTTQRADEGLRADAAFIFEAARSLSRLMVNHRLTQLRIPILGSGHGGLSAEVSLVCMLIAFGELHRRSSHNLKEIDIVVFQANSSSSPAISETAVTHALRFATGLLSN